VVFYGVFCVGFFGWVFYCQPCLGPEQAGLVGADEHQLLDGGAKEDAAFAMVDRRRAHRHVVRLLHLGHLLAVALDGLEEGLDVGVGVDDLVPDECCEQVGYKTFYFRRIRFQFEDFFKPIKY
jgi:hypothetical protein